MKEYLILIGIWMGTIGSCHAAATISLNNKDSNMPIYLWTEGNFVVGREIYAAVIANREGMRPGTMAIHPDTYERIWKVDDKGYFDAGAGIIPGIFDGDRISVQIVAWDSEGGQRKYYSDASIVGYSAIWIQDAGVWDPNSGATLTGPALNIPGPIIMNWAPPIPESKALINGLIGSALLFTNKLAKTLRATSGRSTNTPAKTNAVTKAASAPAKQMK